MKLSPEKFFQSNAAYSTLLILVLVYFSGMVLFEIPQTPFYYDSGIHIDAAKMLAYGLGQPITPYTYELFSTQTTGPTLTWFGAIAVRIFGAHIWTAGFAAASLSLLLLAILCRRLYSLLGRQTLPIFLCLCLLFLLQNIQWWVIFIGDMSSLILFLIATTLAVDPTLSERKRHIYTAIAATLSLRARLTSLPMIAGLVTYLVLRQAFLIWKNQSSIKECIGLFALSFAVFAMINACFESVEYSFFLLSPDTSYVDFLSDRMAFLSGNSTMGVGTLLKSDDVIAQVTGNLSSNYAFLAKTLHEKFGINFTLPLILLSTLLASLCAIQQQNNLDRLITAVFLAFLFIAFWFFVLAKVLFDRYTMQLIFLIFTLLLLSSYRFFSWTGIIMLAVATFIVMPQTMRTQLHDTLLFIQKTDPAAFTAKTTNSELEEAANFLTSHTMAKPLAKCGWMSSTWSIDYLLPPGEHFTDCYKLIRNALVFDAAFYLQHNPDAAAHIRAEDIATAEAHFLNSNRTSPVRYQWQSPVSFTLVIYKSAWRFSKFNENVRSAQKALQDACKPTTLFNNNSVRVMECTFENLQQYIPTSEYSFFVDDTPYWKR
jgi:hypothetical protein